MSQTGTVISAAPLAYGSDWVVSYQYQTDAGQTSQAEIVVGNTTPPPAFPPFPPTVGFWASASSTITVSPNPPGTTNPVSLSCPPLIQSAAFGIPLK
jgi:hypothetical protein